MLDFMLRKDMLNDTCIIIHVVLLVYPLLYSKKGTSEMEHANWLQNHGFLAQ